MSALFLALDLAFPLVFFALGRGMKDRRKRVFILQSLLVFLLALICAPIAYLYFSLSAQGFLCAGIIALQGLLGSRVLY